MLDPKLQLALRNGPTQKSVMRQSWRDLLFLHCAYDPAEIQAHLPDGLTVDTFPDEHGVERAWVGLVPFLMKDVRWSFAPPVPGTHTFPETNVRTYVHRDGMEPGVWFFSLDAANALAVRIARLAFSLPYFRSNMAIQRDGRILSYSGRRRDANYRIDASLAAPLARPEPGSLDFFLVERYLLYSRRGDRLYTGRVFHEPYSVRAATIRHMDDTLFEANGLARGPFVHTLFSNGVDVEVFPLRPVSYVKEGAWTERYR